MSCDPTQPVGPTTKQIPVVSKNVVPVKSVGMADLVGFGVGEVVIIRNGFRVEKKVAVEEFCLNKGWEVDRHLRVLGNTTKTGYCDIIGFKDDGVWVSLNNGDGTFSVPRCPTLPSYFGSGPEGWENSNHVRFVADLRNQGCVDIIGLKDRGIEVSFNDGSGHFAEPIPILPDFGTGWTNSQDFLTLADTTGRGILDFVAFRDAGVVVALGRGNGRFENVDGVFPFFGSSPSGGGWSPERHIRTLARVTRDNRLDLVGFGEDGVWVSSGLGQGKFGRPELVISDFGCKQGWTVSRHPRFVAEVDKRKGVEIIGFGDKGVYVSRNNGSGKFQPAELVLEAFGANQGWDSAKRKRYLADLTGNGVVDIVGFGEEAVWVSYNDGNGKFAAPVMLTDALATNNGWDNEETVRFVANVF